MVACDEDIGVQVAFRVVLDLQHAFVQVIVGMDFQHQKQETTAFDEGHYSERAASQVMIDHGIGQYLSDYDSQYERGKHGNVIHDLSSGTFQQRKDHSER